jgi:hypothetical protein
MTKQHSDKDAGNDVTHTTQICGDATAANTKEGYSTHSL